MKSRQNISPTQNKGMCFILVHWNHPRSGLTQSKTVIRVAQTFSILYVGYVHCTKVLIVMHLRYDWFIHTVSKMATNVQIHKHLNRDGWPKSKYLFYLIKWNFPTSWRVTYFVLNSYSEHVRKDHAMKLSKFYLVKITVISCLLKSCSVKYIPSKEPKLRRALTMS